MCSIPQNNAQFPTHSTSLSGSFEQSHIPESGNPREPDPSLTVELPLVVSAEEELQD